MKAFAYVCAALMVAALPTAARADYVFSGSGASGTLVSPSETWSFNADGGAATTGGLNNWGSPGVGIGVSTYGEAASAYGFQITFSGGGAIDPSSVALANQFACGAGTTFCNGVTGDGWLGSLSDPDSIVFLAQTPGDALRQGDIYFTNIFFDGATPTSFTGSWITSYSSTVTPEPSSLMLLGTGLLGVLGRFASRKRQAA